MFVHFHCTYKSFYKCENSLYFDTEQDGGCFSLRTLVQCNTHETVTAQVGPKEGPFFYSDDKL